ncbi:MAG TPA: hydroxyphenylacetyl-CoA thioesterase PaaI [Beijerinckiaceae bacterium]|nr:hydroxyphenylacetyl-CoA thioesterase PaaI [Beijerinckiaceae bacterium]
MNADDIAKKSTELMWAEDNASAHLGMKLVHVGPGKAVLTMPVAVSMTNGHGTCHGGYIFTLADSAFAFACNSYNQRCVAAHCSITYLAPARAGMLLRATAAEQQRVDRNGIYDITITDDATGAVIAEFRGHSRTIAGTFF